MIEALGGTRAPLLFAPMGEEEGAMPLIRALGAAGPVGLDRGHGPFLSGHGGGGEGEGEGDNGRAVVDTGGGWDETTGSGIAA